MKPRHKLFVMVAAGVAALGIAAALVLSAFEKNLVFFYTPTQVAANEAPQGRSFRIGGLVAPGSVQRQPDGSTLHFVVDRHRQKPASLLPRPAARPVPRGQGCGGAGQTRRRWFVQRQ